MRHEQLAARGGRDIELVTATTVAEGGQNVWRESDEDLGRRIDAFAAWLHARPEHRIAVVGHGDFWHAFTHRIFGSAVRLANCGFVVYEGPLGPSARVCQKS